MLDWFFSLFDVTLLATIGLIFAATLVGAYFRSTRRDPCLKSFDGYHVTLEQLDGKMIWGTLCLESTGLELLYRNAVEEAKHLESSYIIYSNEYKDMRAVYRYADELTAPNRERREEDIRAWFHPGPRRRLGRSFQHFTATAAESLNEVFSLILGRLRKPAGRYITEEGETHLRSLGDTVIGHVGHAHDPLLERYVGQKVVFEMVEQGDEVHEHVGILKNYSPDFLEILDVLYPQRQSIKLSESSSADSRRVTVFREGDSLFVTNNSQAPVLLLALEDDGQEEPLNVVVESLETVEIDVTTQSQSLQLHMRVLREVDMVVPRTRCLIRHRVDRFQPELVPELIFDLGVVIKGDSRLIARELRLRRQLDENPGSALLMSNLGAVLMQRRRYAEAEEYLREALDVRYSLPDNGRRAEMLLAELERHQAKGPQPLDASVAERVTQEVHQAEGEFVDQSTAAFAHRAEADRAVSMRHW